jgi:hypothetical protein
MWCRAVLAVCLVLGASGAAEAEVFSKSLVRTTEARVHATAATSAPVLATLPHGALVYVRRIGTEWCDVSVSVSPRVERPIDGVMRCGDLVQSAGLEAFAKNQFAAAA